MRCRWNERQEQRHLDRKYRVCSGTRGVQIGWNTAYVEGVSEEKLEEDVEAWSRLFCVRGRLGTNFTVE